MTVFLTSHLTDGINYIIGLHRRRPEYKDYSSEAMGVRGMLANLPSLIVRFAIEHPTEAALFATMVAERSIDWDTPYWHVTRMAGNTVGMVALVNVDIAHKCLHTIHRLDEEFRTPTKRRWAFRNAIENAAYMAMQYPGSDRIPHDRLPCQANLDFFLSTMIDKEFQTPT